jgi:pilus assembly protein CpaF
MFGRKNSELNFGFAEDNDEWEGPPKQEVDPEKIQVPSELTEKIRVEFYKRINPAIAAKLPRDELFDKINQAVMDIVEQENIPLNWREQSAVALDIVNDMVGIGPIEALLNDDDLTDILVNGPNSIFVEKNGRLFQTDLKFRDETHLQEVARRIALSAGRRVDESSPMVDARLADGSRINIIIPPLSVHGTILSIRKFPNDQITFNKLVDRQALTQQMAEFLKCAAASHLNIVISGGTGAGKTTILNALSADIDDNERVVTIEDAAEINLIQPHVISLETRQRNVEGSGEVSLRDLLRNALRMRPDRIIIGEVRGPEAYDMLQAMNTGHDGAMSTVHANSPRDALMRIEDLVISTQANFHPQLVRRQLASAVDLVIHVARDFRGHRYIRSIEEVIGVENDVITMGKLFSFEENAGKNDADFEGDFVQHAKRAHCEKKATRYGYAARIRDVLK